MTNNIKEHKNKTVFIIGKEPGLDNVQKYIETEINLRSSGFSSIKNPAKILLTQKNAERIEIIKECYSLLLSSDILFVLKGQYTDSELCTKLIALAHDLSMEIFFEEYECQK